MNIIRITNPNDLRPAHVVMLGLVILALAGNCLLTSAGKPNILPDGAVNWNPDSILLAVIEILDLQYAQPTPQGTAIKSLVHGMAAGMGILIATLGIVALSRGQDERGESDTVIDVDRLAVEARAGTKASTSMVRSQLDPIFTAQGLMVAYLLWSFASQWWSEAPQFALGGTILLATQVVWAFALAYGLNRRAAVYSAYIMLVVLFATGGLAILYHAERNPILRASYPIGNPLFLAACLVPGLLLAVVVSISGVLDTAHRRLGRGLTKVIGSLVAVVVLAYAFWLTQSRGPAVGLAAGVAAVVFFSGRRKVKLAVSVISLVGLIGFGAYFFSQRDALSATGRSDSMRVRFHAWGYAVDLIREHPLAGQGQGGYALLADALATADVENDPVPLAGRISHAHNEWLEIGSDLGSVGLVLVLGSLLLTLYGGALAIPQMASRAHRWTMAGLLSSLAALMVSECFGVGLRIEGLPLVYYTVIGLIWAMARPVPGSFLFFLARRRWAGWILALMSVVVCLAVVEYSRRDFAAARALYDVDKALVADKWDEAIRLAQQSFDDRLSVQRKLTALREKVRTELRIGATFQEQYIRRLRAVESLPGSDPALAAHILQSRRKSEAYLVAGLNDLAFFGTVCPSAMSTGTLEYDLHQTLATFAAIDGNEQAVDQHRNVAAEALQRQIARQPFEPALAVACVMVAGDRIEMLETIGLLARPLRTRRAPIAYLELAGQLAQTEERRGSGYFLLTGEPGIQEK